MAEKQENNETLQNLSDETCTKGENTESIVDSDVESKPLVIGGVEFGGNAYHDAYRNGNFGMKRGRINFIRAKSWSIAHFVTAFAMTCFTIPCVVLIQSNHAYWIDTDTTDGFTAVAFLCDFFGLATSCCCIYLVHSLATIRRPLFLLLLARVLAVLECLLVIAGIVLTIIVASAADNEYPWWKNSYRYRQATFPNGTTPTTPVEYIANNKPAFTTLCSFLVISMVIDWITASAWMFHWWRCFNCFQGLKSVCIFEPGEPLASGVSDPPTGFFRESVYVCWSIYRIDWTFI